MGTAESCKGGGCRRWESNPIKVDDEKTLVREEITESSLPDSLQSLGQLLSAVAGESSDYYDPKWDQEWPNSSLVEAIVPGFREDRDKRFSPVLISAALPIFTHFAGGLLTPMLQQLMYRTGKQNYKKALLMKFCHRALSNTQLAGGAVESTITQANI